MNKIPRLCWIIAASLILINGLLHLHGIFYTEDLNPANSDLIPLLKSSGIQMDASASFWKLWIGFNALFSIGFIFLGLIIVYLAVKHFATLCNMHFVLLLTIGTNACIVWLGFKYLITAFVISLAVPLFLFVIGYTLILLGRKEVKP